MPVLQLEFDGNPVNCGITKVDRSKLYGYTKKEILDDQGRACQTATLASDGRTLIPSGGVALAYVSPNGTWREKSELTAVDLNGEPIGAVTSTFKEVVDLSEESSIEHFFDHNIRMVYELQPEEGSSFPDKLLEALKQGKIFTFQFSYRGGVTADTAFVLEGEDDIIWMLIGKKTDVNFLSFGQAGGTEVEDGEAEDEEEELSFDMF